MRTSRFFVVWFALFLLVNGHYLGRQQPGGPLSMM